MSRIVHGVDGSAREVGDDERAGRCYELAVEAVRLVPGATLIHGTIQRDPNRPIGHAWVLLPNGLTWEPIFEAVFTAAEWRAFANPAVLCRHPRLQACALVVQHGNRGPWPECERRQARAARGRRP